MINEMREFQKTMNRMYTFLIIGVLSLGVMSGYGDILGYPRARLREDEVELTGKLEWVVENYSNLFKFCNGPQISSNLFLIPSNGEKIELARSNGWIESVEKVSKLEGLFDLSPYVGKQVKITVLATMVTRRKDGTISLKDVISMTHIEENISPPTSTNMAPTQVREPR